MPLYSIDTDMIRDMCDEAEQKNASLESNLSQCRNVVDNNLSTWTGSAAGSYKESNNLACDSILESIDNRRMNVQKTRMIADVADAIEDYCASLEL